MIPFVDVQNLSKSFGEQWLFDDISFSIGQGQRIGLIARNGTGKSTLLSILCGREAYDSGSIIYKRDLTVGYLEQSPSFNAGDTVLEACFNHEKTRKRYLKPSRY